MRSLRGRRCIFWFAINLSALWPPLAARAQSERGGEWPACGNDPGIFTPPSIQGTLVVPGNLGGMTWSGYAFVPGQNLLFVNTNNLPARVRLIPRDKADSDKEEGNYGAQRGTPYAMLRRFLQSPSDLHCAPPPWGVLTAVNMASGTIRWQVPLGSMETFGGTHPGVPTEPLLWAGRSRRLEGWSLLPELPTAYPGFEASTGKLLWEAPLPASGHATPMIYQIGGKQFVVIAAGGHQGISEESLGDALVAFALP